MGPVIHGNTNAMAAAQLGNTGSSVVERHSCSSERPPAKILLII